MVADLPDASPCTMTFFRHDRVMDGNALRKFVSAQGFVNVRDAVARAFVTDHRPRLTNGLGRHRNRDALAATDHDHAITGANMRLNTSC